MPESSVMPRDPMNPATPSIRRIVLRARPPEREFPRSDVEEYPAAMKSRRNSTDPARPTPFEFAPQLLVYAKPNALGFVAELLPRRGKAGFVSPEMLGSNPYLRALYDIDRAVARKGRAEVRARDIEDVVARLRQAIPSLPHRTAIRTHAARAMRALEKSPVAIVATAVAELRDAGEKDHMHSFDAARAAGELLLVLLAAGEDSDSCREIVLDRIAEGLKSRLYRKPTETALVELRAGLDLLGADAKWLAQ